MQDAAPRLMFAPVSGPRGMGEYARCLALAQAARLRWPAARIRFLLSRDAPYSASTPFEVVALPASVTLSTPQALEALEEFRPHVVVFDNAGRSRQLAAARGLGVRVVYISSRARQRRKGFRLGWMRAIDEHWIAYPRELVPPTGLLERAKLGVLRRPRLRFFETLLPPADEAGALTRLGSWPTIIVVPGGGSAHPGAEDLPARFVVAAAALAAKGHSVGLVAGPALRLDDAAVATPNLQIIRGADSGLLRALFEHAQVVLTNGGDTLVQALTLRACCVAVPIAADQQARVLRCAQLGLLLAPSAERMAADCASLCTEAKLRLQLLQRLDALNWRNRMPDALDALAALLPGGTSSRRDIGFN